MGEKRVIEQVASNEVHNDDWFLKDSPTQDTSKISATNLKAYFGADGTLALDEIANAIAEEYDSTHTYYNTGLVFHEGVLYQCTATSVTGTWDSTKWNVVDIKDLLDNVSTNIGYLWNTISNTIAGSYDTSSTYNTGDYAIYSLKLYRCKDDGVTGAWNSSKWEEVNIPEYIDYVLVNAGKVDDVKVDGTSVVTNKVAEIEIPVKDVQVKTDSIYDSVVDASGNAKIDLSSMTAYGEVPNLPKPIATFKDGADVPMKSLKVAIEPQQDLHGYDAPWVGGAGKNKLPLNVSNIKANNTNGTWSENAYTESGVTFTLLTDNGGNITGIKTNGTASANIYFVLSEGELNWITFDGSYIINGCSNGSSTTYAIQVYSNESSSVRIDNFNQDNYIQSSSSTYTIKNVMIVIRNGYTASNLMFYPMIRLRSVTDATFEPYSNICPITGYTGANVTRTGKNLCNPEECASVQTSADVTYRNGYVISKVGTYTIKSYNNTGSNVYIYYKIIENGEYGTSQIIQQGAVPGPSKTITITEGQSVVIYDAIDESLNKSKALFENVQIEVGSSATTFEPYNGSTYTIDLDGTRYGGELDVVNGSGTDDRAYIKGGWTQYASANGYKAYQRSVPNPKGSNLLCNPMSNMISEYGSFSSSSMNKNIIQINYTSESSTITAYMALQEDASADDVELCYELATPLTIQLTPTAVKSLLGQNNVWADTGDINECVYRRDMSSTIDDIIARLEALEG